MSTPEEKKLAKLEALLKLVDESISREEFVESFQLVIGVVEGIKSTNESEFDLIHKAVTVLSDKLKGDTASELADIKREVRMAVSSHLETIQKKLATIKDGKPGPKGGRGEPGKGIPGKPGKDGTLISGEEIIKKINKADTLINKDAIKGFAELEKAVAEKTGNTTTIGWGAHPLTVQGLGVTVDKNTRFINFKGSGLASVTRTKSGVVEVTLQAGAGTFYTETPSGLINGSNTTYTVANTITTVFNLAINGQYLHPTVDYTFTGTTITMVTALDASLSGRPFTITYS